MKILLTLDLNQPYSPERVDSEKLLRLVWDQLQVTGITTEAFFEFGSAQNLASWAREPSSINKYLERSPSPLKSYDLIIGINLSPGVEALFTSLKIRTLILRAVPSAPFARMLLARANFPLPEEFLASLPALKNLCHQNFRSNHKSMEDRVWWLANRFLLNQGRKDSSILFLGTSLFQTERLRSGSLINLATYADPIAELLRSCPNFYYSSSLPMDYSELRFMKSLGATCPSLSIPQLLARDEFQYVVSLDSGFAPVAAAFNKEIMILGTQPTWATLQVRRFCDISFLSRLLQAPMHILN